MRICLASIHPRLLSGQIDALAGLARALRARGHTVQIASAFDEEDLLNPRRAFGVSAEAGHLAPRLARIGKILRELHEAGANADVIQLNLPTPSFGILADLLQRSVRSPVVVGFEAHLPQLSDIFDRGRWRAAPAFYLPRLVANNSLTARLSGFRATRYVVSSRMQADELERLGAAPERIATIPNLFDWSRLIDDVASSPEVDAIPDDGPLVSYIGHFNHVKGVDVLARAMPALCARHPSARLAIAWSGLGPAEQVKREIAMTGLSDRIHLLGRVSVSALLKRSTVAVLPYRLTIGQAAFPGLVLEAMAVGVPLVTSDLPLLRELVAEDDLALLARPEDPADFAAKISELIEAPRRADIMVERQRHAIQTRFDPAYLAGRYEQLYAQVVRPAVVVPERLAPVAGQMGQAAVLSAAEHRRWLQRSEVREPERRVG